MLLVSFGSRVYGAKRDSSDRDFILVMKDEHRTWKDLQWFYEHGWLLRPKYPMQERAGFVDLKHWQFFLFEHQTFLMMLRQHALCALECLFLPSEHVWIQTQSFLEDWVCDRALLRESILHLATCHWEEAEQLFASSVQRDILDAKKKISHCFRFLLFGEQLAKTGMITDYKAASFWQREVVREAPEEWAYFQEKVLPHYLSLRQQFCEACGE
ncbi:MAG: hypothetical protein H6727_18105 [Myxococcales bacterium]|nr:hypothetical protein [Myxococcales bacterium]